MRLGDLDALLKELNNLEPRCANKYVKQGIDDGLHYYMPKILGEQPTVDAVPVVRCKDCRHRGDHEVCPLHDIRLCFDGDGHMDEVEDDKTEDEFFCAYGERKEAEGDG